MVYRQNNHPWYTIISGKNPRHSSTPKSQVGTPLQNPLLKRAVNNNARCSILSGRGGEDNQDEEVEKVTYSAKLKGAETREEVEDLLKAVADNKNCLVCLFSNRVFTQHRNCPLQSLLQSSEGIFRTIPVRQWVQQCSSGASSWYYA